MRLLLGYFPRPAGHFSASLLRWRAYCARARASKRDGAEAARVSVALARASAAHCGRWNGFCGLPGIPTVFHQLNSVNIDASAHRVASSLSVSAPRHAAFLPRIPGIRALSYANGGEQCSPYSCCVFFNRFSAKQRRWNKFPPFFFVGTCDFINNTSRAKYSLSLATTFCHFSGNKWCPVMKWSFLLSKPIFWFVSLRYPRRKWRAAPKGPFYIGIDASSIDLATGIVTLKNDLSCAFWHIMDVFFFNGDSNWLFAFCGSNSS